MNEGKLGFLRSGPDSSTTKTKSAKLTVLFKLKGGELAVAELCPQRGGGGRKEQSQ